MEGFVATKLDEFDRGLQMAIPELPSYPAGVHAALLLLTYAIGVAGFLKYTILRSALLAHDWEVAAAESGIETKNKAYNERNAYTAALFRQA